MGGGGGAGETSTSPTFDLYYYTPQTVFVEGMLYSLCPYVCPSVHYILALAGGIFQDLLISNFFFKL